MTPEAHWGQNVSYVLQLITKDTTFSELEAFFIKTQLSPPLQNLEQSTDQILSGFKRLGGPCHGPQLLVLTGEFPVPSRRPPTLHVKDRVQGFLVSRSMTPQWMSGSNSLSVKSTQTLPWAHQTFLPLF